MITIKTIKWLILSFINNFEYKQHSNSANQLSIPIFILNFEYVFAFWVKKADHVCVLSKDIKNVTRMASLKSRWYLHR